MLVDFFFFFAGATAPQGATWLRPWWRLFGFHLRKAIAPETLVIKQPQSVLKPTAEKAKSLLLVTAEADRKDGCGSKKGKPLTPNFDNTNKSNLRNHSHDSRDLSAEKEKPMSELNSRLRLETALAAARNLIYYWM